MKHLEIIQLRLAGALPSGLVEEIRQSVVSEKDPASVAIYCRANIENDIAIHLHLKTQEPGNQTSALGLRLAEALKEYGMVEHTVWLERNGGNNA